MTLGNPYYTGDDFDNDVRPYSRGITEHERSISTIVLYTGSPSVSSNQTKNINYNDNKNTEKGEILVPRVDASTDKGLLKSSPTQVATLQNTQQGLYYGVFNNFSLIEVMETKDSIVKLHQNFGNSWNLFFFGDSPSAYTFRGVFLDTVEYPYYQEFMTMYSQFLEGRKCVERGYKMKIAYDGKVVGGYLINVKTSISADQPHTKAFSFTVIITDENYLRNNAVVNGTEFTGELGFNQMNNGHRVIRQYPSLISSDITNTSEQTAVSTEGQSITTKTIVKSQQNSITPSPVKKTPKPPATKYGKTYGLSLTQ